MPPPRTQTDGYLKAVKRAVAAPGQWIEVRDFETEANASVTGNCLKGGYLRVEPRDGDVAVVVKGKRYIGTAAPVTPDVKRVGDKWKLSIRYG